MNYRLGIGASKGECYANYLEENLGRSVQFARWQFTQNGHRLGYHLIRYIDPGNYLW